MAHTKKPMDHSQIEMTITVTAADYKKHLQKAADRIAERVAIKGFRKGHAPYEIIQREVGAMAILQEALEPIIKESFYQAITEEHLETVGMPNITVEKLAPDNDIVYKATVALMPHVTLADAKSISVKKTVKPVEEKKMEETLLAIRGMQATETIKEGPATGTDKILLDMNMFLDGVAIEGGQAKNYQVYLSEPHYIPGFNEHVSGMKKGEEKRFSLDIPPAHYQKHLAGKKVDITVKVHDVYERTLPELSDDIAKKLGQDSVEALKKIIASNMALEAEQQAEQQFEIAILDAMIAGSSFDDIPEVIINAERQKMMYELKRDLDKQGIPLEKYLEDIKKKETDVFSGFKAEAEKRAKAAILSRHIAKEQHLAATTEEIDAEIAAMKDMYKHEKEYLDRLELPEVRDTIATMVQNKKVLAWLKEQGTKKN